ncbi:MAG: class II fructose-bisphosphate aldolase [bacterium]|nr:class II fructose-bisphosphate aldolase [bacterium]
MITTLVPVLHQAQLNRYAVGAFNTNNLEFSQAIIEAAHEEQAPVIIQLSPKAMVYGGKALFCLTQELAANTDVPVVIHLDHGRKLSDLKLGLEWQMSSVMMDASALSFKRNVDATKEAVRLAHRHRASVEGELGTIGGQEDYVTGDDQNSYSLDQIKIFAKETRVDALALGLGTSHGLPVKNEHVDQNILKQARAAVTTPLVLHGASNIAPLVIRKAILNGITKINIDTELRQPFTGAVRHALATDHRLFDPREYLGVARAAVKERVKQKIRLFGSANKANYGYPRFR